MILLRMNPMNHVREIALFLLLAVTATGWAADEYPQHPDSKKQEGVPQGELIKFTFDKSKVFPGTTREVTVYVPKQYDGKTPACVYEPGWRAVERTDSLRQSDS